VNRRRAILGLLLLALAAAPVLAVCEPAGDAGCCCHAGKCASSLQIRVESCCSSGDSVPAPAPPAAPGSSAPQVEDLPPKPEVATAVAGSAPCGDLAPHAVEVREAPPDLYTLHASLLI
jgi:hypothetical protein